MARPKRNNADYFSHDSSMRNDPKIKALRNKFGITGYAVYSMMLEVLTNSDFFKREIDEIEIEILSADFGIEADLFESILAYMVRLRLLQTADNCEYLSQKLTERFQSVTDKRNNARSRAVSVTENPQSKVKHSKVKKSKEDIKDTCYDFELFWECYERKGNKKTSEQRYSKIKESDRELIKSKLPLYIQSTSDKQFRKDAQSWISKECWNDEIDLFNTPVKTDKRQLKHMDGHMVQIFVTADEALKHKPQGAVNNNMLCIDAQFYFNPWGDNE